jgi:demethoxyubiquinone hydroxylase (CLK1/Coq7/Cat5 family)
VTDERRNRLTLLPRRWHGPVRLLGAGGGLVGTGAAIANSDWFWAAVLAVFTGGLAIGAVAAWRRR